MKAFISFAGIVMAIVAGAAIFAWSGAYNVAADDPHWSLTTCALQSARERSIEVRAAGIEVPDLEREELIRDGAGNYDAMCVSCHLRPGLGSTELSKGLNPAPPDLRRRVINDPAEAFWIIKHGIKMTGMPAWGRYMEDEYIWGIVAFLRKMPGTTPDTYRQLVESSRGHSHAEPDTHVHE